MVESGIILASTSRFRKELLSRLRIPFRAVAPDFDEISPAEPVTPDGARAAALENARGKALSLRGLDPHAHILASDQICECEGRQLRKAATEEQAFEQLRFLSGREHRLHTAVALFDASTGNAQCEVVTNTLRMRVMGEGELRRYIALDQPLQSAGSYLSEGLGIALFEWIRGDDPTAVIGLPLICTCRLLEAAGLSPLREQAAG